MIECPHCKNLMGKVKYPIANDRFQCKLQCQECGYKAPEAIKFPDNFNSLPLLNQKKYNEFEAYESEYRTMMWEEKKKQENDIYKTHLGSPAWKAKRVQVMARCDGVCENCEESSATEVHHITYANFGNEKLWELLGVCHPCHEDIHGRRF